MLKSSDRVIVARPEDADDGPMANPPAPAHVYSWDFDFGLGPWTSWLAPSVVTEPGGTVEQFTRMQAPGPLDYNHIDGVGAIWLVAHLSTPTLGSPGVLNLHDAEFQMTVRGTDFDINGGQLVLWATRYVPETGVTEGFYFGLQVTNWANTGSDMAGQITDDWVTITLQISDDPADWTYAGNQESLEGDWADRYVPFDLGQTLSAIDATLHLVVLNADPDAAPTGFLDPDAFARTLISTSAAKGDEHRLHVFSLTDFKDAVGSKWDKLSGLLEVAGDAIIRRHVDLSKDVITRLRNRFKGKIESELVA